MAVHENATVEESRVRIILDVDNASDLPKALALAQSAIGNQGTAWDYWSSDDPSFTATIRMNKSSISVRGRRARQQEARDHG